MRLGLERARTCREAIEVMTGLLETYGQGGSAELKGNSHFDSSFLMSDAGRRTSWKPRAASGRCAGCETPAPSPTCSGIRRDWDRCSVPRRRAPWTGRPPTGFRKCRRPSVRPTAPARPWKTLARAQGTITARTIFDLMRQHGGGYHPATAPVHSLCMHAGPQKDRWWQADGVMVGRREGR